MSEQAQIDGMAAYQLSANVKPSDIDVHDGFCFCGSAFGKAETEFAAVRIVRFCQQNGDEWNRFVPDSTFPLSSVRTFLNDHGDGSFSVTPEFIRICHVQSPRRR